MELAARQTVLFFTDGCGAVSKQKGYVLSNELTWLLARLFFRTGRRLQMVDAVEISTEVCSLFPAGSKMANAVGISTGVCSVFPTGSERWLMQWRFPLKFALCFLRDRKNG